MRKLKINHRQQQALARLYYDQSIESCAEKVILDEYESIAKAIFDAKNDGTYCYLPDDIFDRVINDLIEEVVE